MSEPYITFPDVEQLVVDLLKDRSELAGVVVDVAPPSGFDGSQRAVLVSRMGGAWAEDPRLDNPLVDLEVYGPSKAAAHTVSLVARSLMLQLRGVRYGGATVVDVVEEDGPRWLPDYRHGSANRYVSTTRLVVRPA
ncbi:hypothetical protein TUSST3_89320 [Streptomyces sp. TUS-ST3]|jgi:hypothetical protein|uniref:hypothetical protein n=1 Tax=Streptomyces sp. TUS-ST3 TaxID=3025591 RepID=UPI00235B30C1|nr:hypothetical protein [Streptomyces sp. TUS-ST3]GLP72314.1 hypothetical protein TUSST3_89320 [Streptomyces sp. TUS-ST3]